MAGFVCRYDTFVVDVPQGGRSEEFWPRTNLLRVQPAERDCEGGFRARTTWLRSDAALFADIALSPFTTRRPQAMCRRDGADDIFFSLQLNRRMLSQTGASAADHVLPPGAMQVADMSQPYASRWEGGMRRGLHLHLPRAAVAAALRSEFRRLNGLILSPAGLGPMLAAQMRALGKQAGTLSPLARAIALEATVALALTALRLELGAERIAAEVCEDGLFTAACCYIDRNLASPDLAPERIAARLRCSRAHLYRVFARHDLTIADYIREARLQRCRAALEATTSAMESIADIAFRFGFENPVYFSRLFRLRFGFGPSEARRNAA